SAAIASATKRRRSPRPGGAHPGNVEAAAQLRSDEIVQLRPRPGSQGVRCPGPLVDCDAQPRVVASGARETRRPREAHTVGVLVGEGRTRANVLPPRARRVVSNRDEFVYERGGDRAGTRVCPVGALAPLAHPERIDRGRLTGGRPGTPAGGRLARFLGAN